MILKGIAKNRFYKFLIVSQKYRWWCFLFVNGYAYWDMKIIIKYFQYIQFKNVKETELAAVAKECMPNIPGMDMFK